MDLSRDEFASRAHVTPQTIYRWERDGAKPQSAQFQMVRQLAEEVSYPPPPEVPPPPDNQLSLFDDDDDGGQDLTG